MKERLAVVLFALLMTLLLLTGCPILPTATPEPTICPDCPTCAPTITPKPTKTPTAEPATPTPAPTWDGVGFKWSAKPELLMVCQGDGGHGLEGNNGYYLASQSVSVKAMNPAPGVFNFQAPDASGYLGQSPVSAVATVTALNDKNIAAGRDPFYLWLQVLYWSPGNDWIQPFVTIERLPYVGNPGDGTFPNPFDPRVIGALRSTVREQARLWNDDPRVSGAIVSSGEYNEFNVKYVCAVDTPGHKADCGSEPDNVLILAAIRRVKAETGVEYTPAQMIASYDDGSGYLWQHRWQYYLFTYWAKPMIEMHAEYWTKTPLVVQLGNMSEWHFGSAHCGPAGAAGNPNCGSFVEHLARYVADTLGPRGILKQDGLGNSSTYAYAALMGGLANKTRVAWEPGNTLPSGDMLNAAIVTGKASAICFQVGFYDDAVAIPFSQQKTMLRDNYQKYFWPLVQP